MISIDIHHPFDHFAAVMMPINHRLLVLSLTHGLDQFNDQAKLIVLIDNLCIGGQQ